MLCLSVVTLLEMYFKLFSQQSTHFKTYEKNKSKPWDQLRDKRTVITSFEDEWAGIDIYLN